MTSLLLFPRYLPSKGWLRACEPYATLGGAAAAMLDTYHAFHRLRHQERVSGKRQNLLGMVSTLVFSMFLLHFPVADLIRRSVPAFVALGAGDRVEHAFINEKTGGTGRKYCRCEVEIRDMPFLTRLCGMPESFRA